MRELTTAQPYRRRRNTMGGIPFGFGFTCAVKILRSGLSYIYDFNLNFLSTRYIRWNLICGGIASFFSILSDLGFKWTVEKRAVAPPPPPSHLRRELCTTDSQIIMDPCTRSAQWYHNWQRESHDRASSFFWLVRSALNSTYEPNDAALGNAKQAIVVFQLSAVRQKPKSCRKLFVAQLFSWHAEKPEATFP